MYRNIPYVMIMNFDALLQKAGILSYKSEKTNHVCINEVDLTVWILQPNELAEIFADSFQLPEFTFVSSTTIKNCRSLIINSWQ